MYQQRYIFLAATATAPQQQRNDVAAPAALPAKRHSWPIFSKRLFNVLCVCVSAV